MSCAAKYSVPDGRLLAAGAAGLRVRCSRCRAIMVVASGAPDMLAEAGTSFGAGLGRSAGDDEDTRKELRFRPRSSAASTASTASSSMGRSVGMMSASSGEGQVSETLSGVPMPAALSASGVFRPLPGVHRQVTGLFFPELDQLQLEGKPTSSRVWYAAIDGRPRGPFSATEMMSLAERGKVRDASLVWRPGFASWKKVRHGEVSTGEDLSWLRKVVLARKLREIDAAERAEEVANTGRLPKVQLTRSRAGKKPADRTNRWQGGGAGMPPALPDEALHEDDAVQARDRSDPSREISLPHATLREPGAWRADELPALSPSKAALRARGTQRARTLPPAVMYVAVAMLALATVVCVASAVLRVVEPAAVLGIDGP